MINGPTISNALTRSNKSEIIGWGMPDYTAGISKTFKAISTAETNGFFEVIGTAFWNNHLVVRINGLERTLATSTNNTYSTVGYNLFPVRKGDTIEGVSSYNNTGSINFYPCKG